MRQRGIQGAKRRGKRGEPRHWTRSRIAGPISCSGTSLLASLIGCGSGICRICAAGRAWSASPFIVEVFSRRIVGWQLASHMRTDLVLDALRMALGIRRPGADFRLVAHSDRGRQYSSAAYTQVLDDHRVLASVGSVGDAFDNAMAASFVDSFKTELIADRVWRTRSQLELAVVEYVSWFNHDRLHESLGDIPPVEFEQHHAAIVTADPEALPALDDRARIQSRSTEAIETSPKPSVGLV